MSKKVDPKLIDALEEKKRKDFLEAHEAQRQELIEKFGMHLVPVIRTAWHGGTEPGFAIQKVDNIKVQKANENSNQSETNGSTDSDNQTPKE